MTHTSILSRALWGALSAATLSVAAMTAAPTMALADDWHHHRHWEHHRHWREPYAYGAPAYGYGAPAYVQAPPPVVYGPPPPPPGLNLMFNIR